MKTQEKMKRASGYSFRLFLLLLLPALLLGACSKDFSDDQPQNASALYVVNASPGPLAINFFLDNSLVNGPALSFTEGSHYILAFPGSRKFDATSGGTTQSLLTDTLQLEVDKYYSLFVSGENSSLSTLLTEDDLTDPPAGKAKIRFIQLSPDGGTLALGVKDGSTLFQGQTFKTASEFITIDPAAYTLELEDAGGATIREATLNAVAGKIYTVWAGGLSAGTGETELGLQINGNN